MKAHFENESKFGNCFWFLYVLTDRYTVQEIWYLFCDLSCDMYLELKSILLIKGSLLFCFVLNLCSSKLSLSQSKSFCSVTNTPVAEYQGP